MPILGRNIRPHLDPVTVLWLNQLITLGNTRPSFTVITAVDKFVKKCRVDGNLTQLDRFWLFAQDVQANAKISIVNPTSSAITEVNSPTWASLVGYTGNASNMYLNTNANLSLMTNYTQNAASCGIYSRTNSIGVKVDMSAVTSGGTAAGMIINIRNTGTGQYNWSINTSNFTTGLANSDSRGFFVLQRTTSTAANSYINGSLFGTSSGTSTSAPNLNVFILTENVSGSPSNYSDRNISIAFIGGILTQSTFYTAVQQLATDLGFQV